MESNQFHQLSSDFAQSSLEILRLPDNPLQDDIEGFVYADTENCLDAVRQYFVDLSKNPTYNNEYKVLLIGNGNVGKSCLVQRLTENSFNENWDSTHGIALKQYTHLHDEVTYLFNLWDFGGQDIYHVTHRLFLQSNALYLILWDLETEKKDYIERIEDGELRKYENYKLSYWLHYVKAKGSPVIVVQTKAKHASKIDSNACTAKIEAYRQHFNLEFKAIDSKLEDWDSNGCNDLLSAMRRMIKDKQIESGIPQTPKNRADLRQALRDKQKLGEKVIDLDEYLVLANNFEKEVALSILNHWLVFTGVVFYRNGYFGNKIILDQAWAIEAIYDLFRRTRAARDKNLTYYFIQSRGGKFTGEDLQNIWKEKYSKSEQSLFIGFMLACELCFETTEREYKDLKTPELEALPLEKRHFIAPQMMSEIMPKSIEDSYLNKTKNWYLNYEHELWHYGILQSFIVETQSWADTREIWQLGILLKDGEHDYALVECRRNTVYVRVTQGSKGLLDKIRNSLNRLQKGQDIKESVSTDGANYVSLKRLKAHPRENPKILSKQGNWLSVSDFNAFRDPDEKIVFEPKTRIVSEAEQLIFKIANMTIENLQEDVRSQIKRAKTDKAIELIEQWAIAHNEESIKKEIAKIQGDWRRLKTDDMQGTIDSNEKEIRMNKIHVKLLNIKDMSKSSNDVNEPVMPHNNPIPEPNDWYGITFSLVCVGALAAGAIGVLPFEKALLWMVAVIFLFMVVGIFQLSNANKLSQENFMLWMKMFFAKIPGLSFFSEKKMNN